MKLFVASLIAEVNSFSGTPTGLEAFRREGIRRGPHDDANPAGIRPILAAVRDVAEAEGWEVTEGLCAAAPPLGPVVQSAYEWLRDEILDDLRKVSPVDAVVLLLHGAMIAERCDDCEGDLLAAIRAHVGPDVPIGVELDLHCHLTERMCAATSLLVAYHEYPHTDIAERAAAVTRLTIAAAHGRIQPVLAVHDCRMVGLWPTTRQPMRGFVDHLKSLEGRDGVLSVSLAHGFAYGDVPEAGAKLWVISDGDRAGARRVAERLGQQFWQMREAVSVRATPLQQAIEQIPPTSGRPLALADIADNPGGGAHADSTYILEALLRRGLGGVAVGGIWDPGAVQICRDAGSGSRLLVRVGGKSGPAAGHPLDIQATVRAIREDHWQSDFGERSPLGPSAWLTTDCGIDIVLISRCQQVLGREMFEGLGISLERLHAIVVKSTQHFQADFGPVIGGVVHVDTPGLLRTDFENIAFARRSLNFWPRVADPFTNT